MFEADVRAALRDQPLGGLRVYESIGSTNDEAIAWAGDGAPDACVVIADEQKMGRGRAGRTWFTPPGSAIAMSIILRPNPESSDSIARVAGLGAIGVAEALDEIDLDPSIKWPNDILLKGDKVGGILVESIWTGDRLEASILGIGVNVSRAAVPLAGSLNYPATSLEDALGRVPDRLALLPRIVAAILRWRSRLSSETMIAAWEHRLAFRGEQVQVTRDGKSPLAGTCLGLDKDGSLLLRAAGQDLTIPMGEVHLLPGNDKIDEKRGPNAG